MRLRKMLMVMSLITACNNFGFNSKPKNDSDSQPPVDRYIKQGEDCEMHKEVDNVSDSMLWGCWEDSLLWHYEDSCFYGLKPLDTKMEFTFFKSRKYIQRITHSDSIGNTFEQGNYQIRNSGDSCFLQLLNNDHGDTLFSEGDTIFFRDFLIYSLDEYHIGVQWFNAETKNQKVHEMKRKN